MDFFALLLCFLHLLLAFPFVLVVSFVGRCTFAFASSGM